MATALLFIASGVAVVLVGAFFWRNPDKYYTTLHRTSIWFDFNRRPPMFFVKVGAVISVGVGIALIGWGLGQLL